MLKSQKGTWRERVRKARTIPSRVLLEQPSHKVRLDLARAERVLAVRLAGGDLLGVRAKVEALVDAGEGREEERRALGRLGRLLWLVPLLQVGASFRT